MKAREREAAGPLYIQGQKTVAEIAGELVVNERTVRNWKEKDGWDKKRKDFLSQRTRNAGTLESLINDLQREIAADRKKKRRPSTSRLYALRGLQKQLIAINDRERRDIKETQAAAGVEEEKQLPPLTPDNFLKIEREHYGLYASAYRN